MSILSELMAWRRGAAGRPLNGHEGPIHQTYVARRELGPGAATSAAVTADGL